MRKIFAAALAIGLLTAAPAMAKVWTVDYTQSSIGFSGTQSGQGFTGKFKTFQTNIDFDPANPTAGKITADIDIASAFTGNGEIDGYLPQSDWFNSSKFPKAQFVSSSIKAGTGPNCFEADGNLSIKGISKAVAVPFCLTTEGASTHAKGQVKLTRTDFNVGTGQWSSEGMVAHAVLVDLDIVAK